MNANPIRAAIVLASIATIAACGSPRLAQTDAERASNYQPYRQSYSSTYGRVESIQAVVVSDNRTSGAGAAVGAVVGGLLGNQVGSGDGRTAATVAGAVGGGLVGNQIEKNRQGGVAQAYQIGVRLDDGSYQIIQQDSSYDLRIGDRVHIQDGRVFRY
jgi:outer membrane lipoprotein SlyB